MKVIFHEKSGNHSYLLPLYETSDLTDFYVIEQGYLQAMDDNPIVHQTNDIIYVRDTLAQIVEKTERRVKFAMGNSNPSPSALHILLVDPFNIQPLE